MINPNMRGDEVGDNCRPPPIFYNSPKNGVLKIIMRFDTRRYPLDIEMSPCFRGNNAIATPRGKEKK
jgi:hypothetical protein